MVMKFLVLLYFTVFTISLPVCAVGDLIQKIAMLKRNCFASVFEKYFEYQQAGKAEEEYAVINYRDDETM